LANNNFIGQSVKKIYVFLSFILFAFVVFPSVSSAQYVLEQVIGISGDTGASQGRTWGIDLNYSLVSGSYFVDPTKIEIPVNDNAVVVSDIDFVCTTDGNLNFTVPIVATGELFTHLTYNYEWYSIDTSQMTNSCAGIYQATSVFTNPTSAVRILQANTFPYNNDYLLNGFFTSNYPARLYSGSIEVIEEPQLVFLPFATSEKLASSTCDFNSTSSTCSFYYLTTTSTITFADMASIDIGITIVLSIMLGLMSIFMIIYLVKIKD
jgi:hypothetical protein